MLKISLLPPSKAKFQMVEEASHLRNIGFSVFGSKASLDISDLCIIFCLFGFKAYAVTSLATCS